MCFGVGEDLSIGATNFFWKGVDISAAKKEATFYLCREQPRYPYPFVIENGNKNKFKCNEKQYDAAVSGTISALSTEGHGGKSWNCTLATANGRQDYNQLSIDYEKEKDGEGNGYTTDLTWTCGKIAAYV